MNKTNKIIAVIISILLVFSFAFPCFASGKEYTITNPYENVDWSKAKAYKTALHTHTNASDGKQTLRESLERHAESDFDIVAVTDHGTVNYSWSENSENKVFHGVMSLIGRSKGELDYLGNTGSFANGSAYEIFTAENGDEYMKVGEKNILRVPYGIENNAISVNAHVNSWFVDYHDNSITTYSDAVRGVDFFGGVCVINHPGEYTKARYELHSEDAYDLSEFSYAYYINKFAHLIDKYDACIGIDVNSKGDARTRYDRILWDELLKRFSAKGKNVYAIASSDAHSTDIVDTGYTLVLCEEKSNAALEKSLRNGEFFAASHCIGNYDELVSIAEGIKSCRGETELYKNVFEAAQMIKAKVDGIENGTYDADESIGITYTVLEGDGRCKAKTHPAVKNICVKGDKISIDTENSEIVRWISGGKVLLTTDASKAEFTVSEYANEIGDYVRAEIFGEGGIIYTQAFLINADEKDENKSVIKGVYIDLGIFDFLLGEFGKWNDVVTRFFKNLF